MSLNLGTEAIEAARRLHTSEARDLFQAIRDALHARAVAAVNTAMECEHQARADMIGYARGLRDVFRALEGAAIGDAAQRGVTKIGTEGEKRRAA